MKKSTQFVTLLALTLALSGCSTCPCSKNAPSDVNANSSVPATATIKPTTVATASTPVAKPVAPAQRHIPAAVMK